MKNLQKEVADFTTEKGLNKTQQSVVGGFYIITSMLSLLYQTGTPMEELREALLGYLQNDPEPGIEPESQIAFIGIELLKIANGLNVDFQEIVQKELDNDVDMWRRRVLMLENENNEDK